MRLYYTYEICVTNDKSHDTILGLKIDAFIDCFIMKKTEEEWLPFEMIPIQFYPTSDFQGPWKLMTLTLWPTGANSENTTSKPFINIITQNVVTFY